MGTEYKFERICDCLCGQGEVAESFWSNDHAFASDYDWHADGIELHCKQCSAKFGVTESVSNPVPDAGGKRVIYFVARTEERAGSQSSGSKHTGGRPVAFDYRFGRLSS